MTEIPPSSTKSNHRFHFNWCLKAYGMFFCGWNLTFIAKIDEIPLNVGCKIAVPRFGCKEPYHIVCLKWLSSILYFNAFHIQVYIMQTLPIIKNRLTKLYCFVLSYNNCLPYKYLIVKAFTSGNRKILYLLRLIFPLNRLISKKGEGTFSEVL